MQLKITENAQQMSAERRFRVRRPVDLQACVDLGSLGKLPCRVVNISEMGAMLILSKLTILPIFFRLLISRDLFEADCSVRHQDGSYVGLVFTSNRQRAMALYAD
jgi:hypothetical protein